MKIKGTLIFCAVLLAAASIQIYWPIFLDGARINLVLALLIAFSFFTEDTALYALAVFFGGWFLRFESGISAEILIITILTFLVFWLRHRLVWPGIITAILAIVFSTVVFYLLIAPNFLYDNWGTTFYEILGNIMTGVIAYEILKFIYERKTRFAN